MTQPFHTINEVLPHRPPMLLIDELLEADDDHAVVRVSITDHSTFLKDGSVPGVVMVEYMAQCVAAFVGYDDLMHGRLVQIGVIMGVRHATLAVDHLYPGDELRVVAHLEGRGEGTGQFRSTVERRGEEIASCRLSVYQGAPRESRPS